MKKTIYRSPIGDLILMAHQGKLVYCNWDSRDCDSKLKKYEALLSHKEEASDSGVLEMTLTQLDEYFQGTRQKFDLPLNIHGTEFQKRVWNAIATTPYASTLTYKQLAEKSGNASAFRAVAGACGANPIAIVIPCHRIISSTGKIGGYTGGLKRKIALLKSEGIELTRGGVHDEAFHQDT